MKEVKYDYEKFSLIVQIPKEIELFIEAAHIPAKEIIDKYFWQMQVEDDVFLSHEKHPTEDGYSFQGSDNEPASKSKEIVALITGFYLSSKKILEFEPEYFKKEKSIVNSSTNIEGGWRMYISYYD